MTLAPPHVVLCWEFGTGISHLLRLAELTRYLVKRGFRVSAVVKEVDGLSAIAAPGWTTYMAPRIATPMARKVRSPSTFASLAHNLGYHSAEATESLLNVWHSTLSLLRPDVVVADFGLGGIIAAETLGVPVLRYGSGFECPPANDPPPTLHVAPESAQYLELQLATEMSDWINRWRLRHGAPTGTWRDYQGARSQTFLATTPEIDPYQGGTVSSGRESSGWRSADHSDHRYVGLGASPEGYNGPDIPRQAKCFLAYLKPHPNNSRLIDAVLGHGYHVIHYDPMANVSRSDLSAPHQYYPVERPVDLRWVAERCCGVINNANHGLTMESILRHIPPLCAPLYIEQRCHADRFALHHLAAITDINDPEDFPHSIDRWLHLPSAVEFTNRYRANHQGDAPRIVADAVCAVVGTQR